jgi:hypothetical protein
MYGGPAADQSLRQSKIKQSSFPPSHCGQGRMSSKLFEALKLGKKIPEADTWLFKGDIPHFLPSL